MHSLLSVGLACAGWHEHHARLRVAACVHASVQACEHGSSHLQRVAVHEAQRRHQEARSDRQHTAGAAHPARRLLCCLLCAAGPPAAAAAAGGGRCVAAHNAVSGAKRPDADLQAAAAGSPGEAAVVGQMAAGQRGSLRNSRHASLVARHGKRLPCRTYACPPPCTTLSHRDRAICCTSSKVIRSSPAAAAAAPAACGTQGEGRCGPGRRRSRCRHDGRRVAALLGCHAFRSSCWIGGCAAGCTRQQVAGLRAVATAGAAAGMARRVNL